MGHILIESLFEGIVLVEKTSSEFYKRASEMLKSEDASKLLQRLAKEEDAHAQYYQKYLNSIQENLKLQAKGLAGKTDENESKEPEHSFPETKQVVEALPLLKERILETLTNLRKVNLTQGFDVVTFFIKQEESAIAFYSDLKKVILANDRPHLEFILEQERDHLKSLISLRSRMLKDA